MYSLRLKFKGIDEHSDSVNIEDYEVDTYLKEMYYGESANDMKTVDMKIDNVSVTYISDSFKIKYARYISCDNSYDDFTNIKTGSYATKTDIIMKKNTLINLLMNFVSLSYDNKLDISQDLFEIPISFFNGKDYLNKNFKFFLEYDDGSKVTNQDSIDIIFRIVNK